MSDPKDTAVDHKSTTPTYAGVNVDHPAIVNLVRNVAKEHGVGDESVKRAMRLSGMPKEVVQKHMKDMVQEKK